MKEKIKYIFNNYRKIIIPVISVVLIGAIVVTIVLSLHSCDGNKGNEPNSSGYSDSSDVSETNSVVSENEMSGDTSNQSTVEQNGNSSIENTNADTTSNKENNKNPNNNTSSKNNQGGNSNKMYPTKWGTGPIGEFEDAILKIDDNRIIEDAPGLEAYQDRYGNAWFDYFGKPIGKGYNLFYDTGNFNSWSPFPLYWGEGVWSNTDSGFAFWWSEDGEIKFDRYPNGAMTSKKIYKEGKDIYKLPDDSVHGSFLIDFLSKFGLKHSKIYPWNKNPEDYNTLEQYIQDLRTAAQESIDQGHLVTDSLVNELNGKDIFDPTIENRLNIYFKDYYNNINIYTIKDLNNTISDPCNHNWTNYRRSDFK